MRLFNDKQCWLSPKSKQKAGETIAFWVLLGVIAGVAAVTVAARWLQKKSEQEAEPAPALTRPVKPPAPPPAPAAVADKPAKAERPHAPALPPADDLTKIKGIGPKISGWLNEAGITTFEQLAVATPAQITGILHEAGYRRANPTTWPQQAALAAAGKWDELKQLQSSG